jgi:aminomethyltransferase
MKNSPLHEKHLMLGAKMADFGGWLMPIEYPGGGVLAEHAAVRESVGVFDVSHLGKASVKGQGALEFLNSILTNDLNRITDGQAQYTLLCNPDGGVVDDLIIYRNSATDFFLIPNASNTAAVVEVLTSLAPSEISVINLHNDFGVIALQGPGSESVLSALGVVAELGYMEFTHASIAGCQVVLCRTGYTGEHGYELVPLWNETAAVWDALTHEIQSRGGLVCGLGARDTLRTEMGYSLHGHELTLSINPVEAGSSWAIGWKKETFLGHQALRTSKDDSSRRRLCALLSKDRGIPRAGMRVLGADGRILGEITSGTFSPTLKKGIGLALVSEELSVGDEVHVDVRGRDCKAEVVTLPFVPSHVR